MKPSKLVIETNQLTYSYGNSLVIDNIDLSVEKNSIYGFLGPNGAGKTTTIKLLVALLHSRRNSIKIFNKDVVANRLEILSKLGSLIEEPSLYDHLSAFDNLRQKAIIFNLDNKRIDHVLELVGLKLSSKKKVGEFSSGMKQRLGIAKVLLSDPELIILDEPTNGLDPSGMIEIRELMKHLCHECGKTIFLSSHLLGEIEKICTDVGIISNGKIVFQGSLNDLNEINNKQLEIFTGEPERLKELLLKMEYDFSQKENKFILCYISDQSTSKLIELICSHSISIYSLRTIEKSLEDLFVKLTTK
ncbi:MAG: ABC transporter ATP-binding protein [Chlorobi bacterium]|nr:ABC transporter ATP-binding protein [Chlorobiota bacterium]